MTAVRRRSSIIVARRLSDGEIRKFWKILDFNFSGFCSIFCHWHLAGCLLNEDLNATMGKKSRKNAAAANAKSGVSGAVAPATTCGAGGSGGIPKKARCVSCLALVKDLSKGHPCPGCWMLYCWRCAKKNFIPCPNYQKCVLPLDRCKNCASARTMDKELLACGDQRSDDVDQMIMPWQRKMFKDIIKERDNLTLEAMPFFKCGSDDCFGDALSAIECFHCAEGPSLKKLFFCSSFEKSRCRPCVEAAGEPSSDAMLELYYDLTSDGLGVSCSSHITEFGDKISAIRSAMTVCHKCLKTICYECVNEVEIKSLAKNAVTAGLRAAKESIGDGEDFHCSHCYWSAKPCTNPTCPNEVGIPTKRCGGCHLDRYCSVECQAVAYPDHIQKCEKIQAKRAAAGKESSEV